MASKIFTSRSFIVSNLFAVVTLISCAQSDHFQTSLANINSMTTIKTDTATLGAGCFWCVEAVFQELDGVLKVTSGYSGGHVVNPTYEQVCAKNTGHVEVSQIVY